MLIQLMISLLVDIMHHHKEEKMQEDHGLCLEGTRRGNGQGMMNLTTLTLPDGVVIDGAVAGDWFGNSVSGKVDVNHDGIVI